ncbi:MAG: hypothetical protein KF732_04275 [Flavobacteriales bacterium]|nr:hypothetical protein [Flavobacteriales bacterium]
MKVNQNFWGGRYNPIIPVYEGVISDKYMDIIRYIDPDYVLYTKGTDLSKVQNLINPKKYKELTIHSIHDIKGLDSTYLLDPNNYDSLLCESGYLYKSALKNNLSFYELNFGFHVTHFYEHDLLHQYKKVIINDSNISEINNVIIYNSVYKSHLSRRAVNTKFLKTDANINFRLELVIAKENTQFEDLIYFWNRQLYFEEDKFNLRQIYITEQQLHELSIDNSFHMLFASLSGGREIRVHSETINVERLQELINTILLNGMQKVNYFIRNVGEFPYQIIGIKGNHTWNQQIVDKQVLIDNDGLIRIPKPNFALSSALVSEKWAVDIIIEDSQGQENDRNKIKLPFGTFLHGNFFPHPSRINKNHDITLYATNETPVVEFKVPNQIEIITSLLRGRIENDNYNENPLEDVTLSEAGMRLSAFLNMFNNDWHQIEEYVFDKFWLQLFKSESDYAGKNREKNERSSIPSGKGIFTYKDLTKEHAYIYKYFGLELSEIDKKDDYERRINDMLQYLINKQGVFIGTKVKCNHCGSNKWYGYAELNNKISCKGCETIITPKMETPLFYKLSEVITGNIISNSWGNSKDFDGNYTVLRALMWLKRDWKNCNQSFVFCPPLDYFTNKGIKSDIDILAIQDGRLVLGEAKNKATEFNTKEIEALAWIGNNLKPDKLILAYNEGHLHQSKVDKLRSLLKVECEIEVYKAENPTYYFRGVFGQPNINNKQK